MASKAVSKSISLNEDIWALLDERAPNTPGRDRSGYIANLVDEDLRSAGMLPAINADEDVAKLTAKVAAAVRKDPTLTDRIEAVLSKSTRSRRLAPA